METWDRIFFVMIEEERINESVNREFSYVVSNHGHTIYTYKNIIQHKTS